ncbi:AAA domain-containing protein [Beggiatoa leptomitoformis]|uniref:AAA domain-containing protein n=2 Tax=Beggiatoa leptomitoformis TaxID=288004 RepID=A0A2N9YE60_9GAMM|nr:MoxR family ATPase [Beggiatoa leptomitoformis]ALG69540.2 AAA domain-containing protein [Beggiatoa leptomitoformis]AUI68639.1 AAA domain-containing protein [Beggiatoa leptomitoformis]
MNDMLPPVDAGVAPSVKNGMARAIEIVQAIRQEISHAVVGQTEVIDQVMVALLAAGHVLLEGVPGLGKTLLVQALAKTFEGKFARIQFTPDLMPSDVTGHALYDLKSEEFKIRKGAIFTHLLLADEINRAPAKTQAALLEVMQELQVTIEGKSFPVPLPFMTLATQNPIEQEGTYPLPEAQLDRFLLKIRLNYPSEQEEIQLLKQVTAAKVGERLDVSTVAKVVKAETIITLQKLTATVKVDERIYTYVNQIIRATRTYTGISVGAGPRGGISLIRAARAMALLAERNFVIPDDVKNIALAVLRHRITLAPELEIEGLDADNVLLGLLEKIDAPRL